jgi:hypothetical protein
MLELDRDIGSSEADHTGTFGSFGTNMEASGIIAT